MIRNYYLVNGEVITPTQVFAPGFVGITGEKITEVGPGSPVGKEVPWIDVHGDYIVPGFIDLHVHGGGGYDTLDGTAEALRGMAKLHASGGTTSMLATTLTASFPALYRVFDACEAVIRENNGDGARILGLHLEGPYFSSAQAGAQDPRYIKNPDPKEYKGFLNYCPYIKRVTGAPELPGAIDFGQELKKRGILASIGHTDATFEQVLAAMEAGFSMVTHLYSAMSTVKRVNAYRVAGVVEAGLFFDGLTAEIIGDGKHLPASLLKLIYKCKGADRMTLCTDATRATGLGDGEYIVGSAEAGQKAIVDDGVAWMPDRKAFAGSVATMDCLLRNINQLAGIPLVEGVKMLSINPARSLGMEKEIGTIDLGKLADLVILDQQLHVKTTIVGGKAVYGREEFSGGGME